MFTGAKSFVDNPVLGSRRLNRAGLHTWRVRAAHALARHRRSRLAALIPPDLREQFDRDGFIVVPEALPPAEFEALRAEIMNAAGECREQQQGDTITCRLPVGPRLRAAPQLGKLLDSSWLRGILAYVGATRSEPLYYLQAIAGGVAEGPADPQLHLHADTFHPSMKAWLFLTDVGEDDRPFTYVPGSHRLTPERLKWEWQRSTTVLDGGDRLSQRGSLRVREEELPALGLPRPRRFCVPANTMVVADTCGFHARGDSPRPSLRVELWAYSRRSPFLPWTGLDLLSWQPIASRRAEWLTALLDRLDERGWTKQHWRRAGWWRPLERFAELNP